MNHPAHPLVANENRSRASDSESKQNSPPPDKIQDKAGDDKQPRRPFSFGAFATSALAIMALVGVFLAAAGYGVALSVETEFGVPHASIFKSSFDLLSLSVWFVIWATNNCSVALEKIFSSSPYWNAAIFIFLMGLTVWVGINGLMWMRDRFVGEGFRIKKIPTFANKSSAKSFVAFSMVFGFTASLGALVGMPLLLVFVLIISALFGIVPAMSLFAGVDHIQKDVIRPEHCLPLASRKERLRQLDSKPKSSTQKERFATCVKIVEGDKTIAKGRVVFSTTENIVLYDPDTGKVVRESISGRTIDVVSQL